jgi:hypothetical protein
MPDSHRRARWDEINRRLDEISQARHSADTLETEEELALLGELDEIEFELGEAYMMEQRRIRAQAQ